MDTLLRGYHVNEATWFYLSLLLILAVFFRFSRVWSIRNLDLLLLLSLAPGLLFVRAAPEGAVGYVWLFAVSGLLLSRLVFDVAFTRRPRLEQNLNAAGMIFLCISALAFLTTKVLTEEPHASAVETVRRADHLLNREDASSEAVASATEVPSGPASSLLLAPVVPLSEVVATGNGVRRREASEVIERVAARMMAILSHAAVILGLIVLGRKHFDDTKLGLAMASLYLLLPCTAYDVSKVNHVLPAALIVWAVVAHRQPLVAGILLGLASGSLFFAAFLLPLWTAFYGRKGALRFGLALGIAAALLLGSLVLTSVDTHSFTRQTLGSIDWHALRFRGDERTGFWTLYDPAYRIPVFVSFIILLCLLTIWPRRKTLEHLISHSAAIIVATQFWYPHQGGTYVLWYLPLMLMVSFRPRLPQPSPQSPAAAAAPPLSAPVRPPTGFIGSGTGKGSLFR